MSRQRDYRQEYAARVARAQAKGFSGYAQERAIRETRAQLPDVMWRKFDKIAASLTTATSRRLYVDGANALMQLDHERAEEVGEELADLMGWYIDDEYPGESIWWYHS